MSCAGAILPVNAAGAVGLSGTEASSRESLSADLELLHLLLPPAIIHSRRTPHEADDGCLACGPSTLAVLR